MKKKEILQSVKVIVLGLVLSLGISFTFAQFDPPAGGPSATNNAAAPINVGSANQAKDGGLSVGAFLVTGVAQFNNDVIMNGLPTPSSNNAALCIDSQKNIKICGVANPMPLSATFDIPSVTCTPWPHENCRVYVMATGGNSPYTYAWTVNGITGNSSDYHGSYFDFGEMTSATASVVVTDSTSTSVTISDEFDFVNLGGSGQGGN